MEQNNNSQDLNDLLVTRNFEVNSLDAKTGRAPVNEKGQQDINNADSFSFDYVAPSGQNYGAVEILLGPNNTMFVTSGDNTARGMKEQDKSDWFQFLQQLSSFAKSRLLEFTITDYSKLKLLKQQMALVTEGYSGNKHYSFSGSPTEARLMIKHSQVMKEGDQRFRYIESLFIETTDGERFKLKTRSLVEGRAQLQHVREGGRPWDDRGRHINEIVEQAKVLGQFRRAHSGKIFEGDAHKLITETNQYYESLRKNIKLLSTQSGYKKYFESWNPNSLTEQDIMVEDLKDLFVETRIDPRIEQALPLLARIKETSMKEADMFEAWAENVVEGNLTAEEEENLKMSMSQPLSVGSDAHNAIEQLPDALSRDTKLTDILRDLAIADPDSNIWENPQVVHRLEELGVEIPASVEPTPTEPAPAEPTPIEPAPTEPAPIEPEPVVESVMSEADMIIQDLINGELDAYDIMTSPKTPAEQYVSKMLQDMYDDVSIDYRLHPDDDFEQILDIVMDRMTDDHGQGIDEDNTPGAIGFMKEQDSFLKRLQELASIK
jgi:hypothetical protein